MSVIPSPDDERHEIDADRRREYRLLWQGGIAAAIVVAIVIVRELLLR